MPNNELEIIIKKIKKLLALSQSPNKSEATLASLKANELLIKYNLKHDDVKEDESKIMSINVSSGKREKPWRIILINAVADVNFCKFLLVGTLDGYRFDLIGKHHNVIIAKSIYEYLEKTITRLSLKKIRKNAKLKYRESFKYGMATEIGMRLMIQKKDQMNQNNDDSEKALIVSAYHNAQRDIDKFLSNFNIKNGAANQKNLKKDAFNSGIEAGKNVGLDKQVTSNNLRLR